MCNFSLAVPLLLIGRRLADAATHVPLPIPRDSSSITQSKELRRRRRREDGANPIQVAAGSVQQGLEEVGDRIQQDAANLGKNIGQEWDKIAVSTQKFVADIPRILPRRRRTLKSCKKLDDSCRAFSSVLRGGEIETGPLLKACRAHLTLMKSGGPALRLVAKDLESNVKKAEKVFKKLPKDGKSLRSLLEREKSGGAHDGSELDERSAAMGLLWIRRSLAFQLDLYMALVRAEVHPREAARDAYTKHLRPFHGWALRKVFPASLSQMPERSTFVAKFGGINVDKLDDERDRMITGKLRGLVSTWAPLVARWEAEFERQGLEDMRRV